MYFLLNLSDYVKSYGHLCQILAFLRCFYFFLILNLILGKAAKFLVEKLSTSEVISQRPHGGWKTPLPVLLGLSRIVIFQINCLINPLLLLNPIAYGGGGIFIPHHHSISCHSETT